MPVIHHLDRRKGFIDMRCTGALTLQEVLGRIRVFRESHAAVQWLAGKLIPGLITGD